MKRVRVIPRLDVKGPNVVKGIHLEGLRIVGKPAELARKYYDQGADELLYIDIVASLYERNNLSDVVEKTASSGVFIPITVGGGIRTLEDINKLLRSGADKVAINTAATRNPQFITKAAEMFGSQCIVGSIEAKFKEGRWEAYIDNGRECTGLDAVEWAKRLVELGAGELLVTSVDRDGTKRGYDYDLIKEIVSKVPVPVVACGGAGSIDDIKGCLIKTKCDGIAFGSILHYGETTLDVVKAELKSAGIAIREPAPLANAKIDAKLAGERTKKVISVVDYHVGNLKSVINAFERLGNTVRLVSTPQDVLESELLVLPGDGAFGYAMKQLEKRSLIGAIKEYAKTGRPLLGICLGMQLLMNRSEEFGAHDGLGIIEGTVTAFKPANEVDEPGYHVPHMGWNELMQPQGASWGDTILSDTLNGSLVYFIHSYRVTPKAKQDALVNTLYGGQEFCSVVKRDNVYGTQFHPEKSGEIGASLIKHFCNL